LSYNEKVYKIGGFVEEVSIHPRVHQRHPEITDEDVLDAWASCILSRPRLDKNPNEYLAVGVDTNGRLIELAAIRGADGSWTIFHAMTPPTKKTLIELRFSDRR
jgi:hypothetical protein